MVLKKYLSLIIFSLIVVFSFPSFSSASILTSPLLTQIPSGTFDVSCSTGDTVLIYDFHNDFVSSTGCPATGLSLSSGAYSLIECDSTLGCSGSGSTLSQALSDSGFISRDFYGITPVGSCSPTSSVCYYDWLILNLVLLFFLSLLCMGLFITYFKREH